MATGASALETQNFAELATRELESASRPITLDLIAGDFDTSGEANRGSLLCGFVSSAAGRKP
jgi:hypothetical protein